MARLARIVIPELPHHVTQRGTGQRDVFFTKQDRHVYLRLLREYSSHYELRVLGYCLMTNHVHLIVVPYQEWSLARAMREVHGRYVRYRNAIDGGSGHVWQSRYYGCAFERVRMANVMRYVELNPVRAGMVARAEGYEWSSARTHLGRSAGAGLVDLDDWRREWSVQEWSAWLGRGEDEVAAIREATHAGRVWGSRGFVEDLEVTLGRKLSVGRPGRPPRNQAVSVGA